MEQWPGDRLAAVMTGSVRLLHAGQRNAGCSRCRRANCFPNQDETPSKSILQVRINAPIMRHEVAAETTEVSFLQFFYISLTACTPFYCPPISPTHFMLVLS
jgi:hypothetical protein